MTLTDKKFQAEFPKELFVPFVNGTDNKEDSVYIGRVTLILMNKPHVSYNIEVDIVFRESKKIYHSVARKYGLEDEEIAINTAIQLLSDFMRAQILKNGI